MSNTTSAARPKRAGEDFVRSRENTSKKPRFDYRNPSTLAADAPEDDPILDLDEIGKAGTQTKRNAVNIEGYESDSDNDNFDARAAEKERLNKHANGASGKKSLDEEDDDMFADLEEDVAGTADGDEDEELAQEGKKRKKDVRFLDSNQIEGQVMNSKSGGHVSSNLLMNPRDKRAASAETSGSSSGGEEQRDEVPSDLDEEIGAGGKKKHAPRLDAFNTRQEEEEGRYDESGNYVRKAADPDAMHDSWLEGLSKKDMKRAREAQEKRDDEQRRKVMEDDAVLTSDLLSTLIAHLETGETPLEALQRLNKGKQPQKKIPKWKQRKQDVMDLDTNGSADATGPAETARRKAVDSITGAADALFSREQQDIYDSERELLMRHYKRETGEEWQPSAKDRNGHSTADGEAVMWEYRWSDARDGGESHGPYDSPTMIAWNGAGYFGEGVEFRRVGGEGWSRTVDFV